MKVFWLHMLKNLMFFVFKLLIVVLFVLTCTNLSLFYLSNIGTEYDNYVEIKGMSNWMSSSIATFEKENVNTNQLIYSYNIEGKKYLLQIEKTSVDSIDNEVNILYDKSNPKEVITENQISKINSFYTDSLKTVCLFYIEVFGLVILLGLIWWLLDYIKYNKVLWGLYV